MLCHACPDKSDFAKRWSSRTSFSPSTLTANVPEGSVAVARVQSSRARHSGRALSAESTLRLAVETLNELGIPYMVTGSLASAFYGEPRSTQDVDIVVPADEARLQHLAERLRDAGLYCDEGAVSEAVSLKGMFNAVDPTSGWKIDFIVLKETAFGQAAFEGRAISELGGVLLHLIRAEDVVVAKLEWAKLGGSEQQIRDVVGVLMVQGPDLDRGYIEGWVDRLDLRHEWDHAMALERQNK